jgi:tripeptidyl-peptidase-1
MMKSSMLLLLGATAAVMAMPAPHDYVVHERRDNIPNSWIQSKKLDGSTTLPVRIGLTQSNLDRGHDLLMEMYDTTHRLYMR